MKDEERQNRKEARRLLRQEIEDRKLRGDDIESLASSAQKSDRSFMSKNSQMLKQKQDALKAQESQDGKSGLDQGGDSEMSPDKGIEKSALDDGYEADQNLGRSAIGASIKEPAVSNVRK